ncbi:MAG: SDR family NAD(P)-dependent oxidoreductase [Erythrobacter sp.]
MDLSNTLVLLTGGSSGIGRETARQLKAKGAIVTVTGRNPDRLAQMQEEGFEVISADLSNAAGVDALIAEWAGRDLDILINNAGQGADHDFRETTPDPDDADDCFYANLNAPIRLITALLPILKSRPSAAIVNVTSGLAIAPRAGGPIYCASKAALRSYSQTLRAQLADANVHVLEALPPAVDTPLTAGREMKKLSPAECARQLIAALEADRDEANIGMVKLLRVIESISPALVRKIMLRF